MVLGQFSWFFMVPDWFFVVSGTFSWFFMVPGWVIIFHVENALKMYSGPTIQSRPCLPWTALAEFTKKVKVFELFLP